MTNAEFSSSTPKLAPTGTVCRSCWHGLKGLNSASVCPECGQPIAAALDPAWWGSRSPEPLARLAGSMGAFLWGCAAFLVFFVGVATLEVFSIRPPESSVLDILLSLLLVVLWGWLAVSLLRALVASSAARLAGKWSSKVGVMAAAVSCVACAAAQTVSIVYPHLYNTWTNIAPVVFVGAMVLTLVSWAFAQRCAASRIGRSPLRALAGVQAAIAVLFAAIFIALMTREVLVMMVAVPPGWMHDLTEWLERPTIALFGVLFVTMIVNLALMRRAIRQFLAARLATG